ncbi:MAG: DUF192 domain-containing protein [Deltaproteobacteria bacterium]|nr:MAG: DUF192 domain-containing protein [Deltaproteobacteria bacterium]
MARVVNVTKGTVLADPVEIATSIRARMKGLLGRNGLERGTGLLIRPCSSIHSFFMRFEFDAVFIDSAWKAVHLIERMRPFRISRIVPRAKAVLELPAGTITATATTLGDELRLEQSAGD